MPTRRSKSEQRETRFFFELIFIILILFSPIFHGSYGLFPLSVIQFGAILLALVWYLALARAKEPQIIYPTQLILLLFFILVVAFQLMPLPVKVLKLLSPETLRLYREYYPNFSNYNLYTLSLYPFSTRNELARNFTYFLIFFVALNAFEKKSSFKKIVQTIACWAFALAFYGVIKRYFLPFGKEPYSFSVFGNKNHFAAYMTMTVPLTVGYAMTIRDTAKKTLLFFMAAFTCASAFLSLSRAGSVSIIFSLIMFFILLRKDWMSGGKTWLVWGTLAIAIGFILFSGLDPIKARFGALAGAWSWRQSIVKDSLPIVKDFPLFGVGWGNFQYIFTSYRQSISQLYYKYLHNDNLQLVVETGVAGAIFYFGFLILTLKNIIAALNKRRDPFVRNLAAGGLCGLLGVLFHNFFDFNFHIPALAFLFWLILGLIYKCVNTRFINEEKKSQ